MDPRNPLGRLDRLSRDPNVASLDLSFRRRGDVVVRTLHVRTADGRERTVTMREGWSWIDLLDRLQRTLEPRS